MKTPTMLPPATFVKLGESFGCSLSLAAARRISHIEVRGSSYRPTRYRADGSGYTDPKDRVEPHYFVDVEIFKANGDTRILRSVRTDLTKRQARDLERDVTRKIAVFLFENRDVKLESIFAPSEKDEDITLHLDGRH